MVSYFYIKATGGKDNLLHFNTLLNIPGAKVKQIKSVSTLKEMPWFWHTARFNCVSIYPEDELERYFFENSKLIERIKNHRHLVEDITVTIVFQVAKNERPEGHFMSSHLLKYVESMDASLDIDVVGLVVES